jgi:uncharacterized integral membrane protein
MAESDPVPGQGEHPDLRVGRTRISSAWTLLAAGLLLVLLMLVFILQNGQPQAMEFLWFDFSLPVGAAMLLAAVLGGLLVILLGATRLLQVRLAARRHRREDRTRQAGETPPSRRPAPPGPGTAR